MHPTPNKLFKMTWKGVSRGVVWRGVLGMDLVDLRSQFCPIGPTPSKLTLNIVFMEIEESSVILPVYDILNTHQA